MKSARVLGAFLLAGSGVAAIAAPAWSAGEMCGTQPATIVVPANPGGPVEGTPGDDVIFVTGTADVRGLGGNDVICGPSDAPATTGGTWDGGVGNDTLTSTSASLIGGDGDDTLTTGAGTIAGGAGKDAITGNGATGITGGDGDDTISSMTATIDGGADNDTIRGAGPTLDGGAGNDTIRGGNGDNTVLGSEGDDKLWGGSGADTLEGGPGTDVIRASARDRIRVGSAAGRTTIDVTARTIEGPDGKDTYTGSPRIWAPGSTDETFVGGNRGDVFISEGGADNIYGLGGNDALTAVQPTRLEGGAGDDAITVAFGGRVRGGAGDDRIRTILSADEAPNLKAQPFNLQGNTGDDIFWAASYRADGAIVNPTPADQLWSGKVRGGAGWDRVVFTPVRSAVTASMATGQATWSGGTMTLGGLQAVWGTPGDDVLTGNNGRSSLLGGAGDDQLNGLGGRDDLRGASGLDRLDGGTGSDRCRGETKVSCER